MIYLEKHFEKCFSLSSIYRWGHWLKYSLVNQFVGGLFDFSDSYLDYMWKSFKNYMKMKHLRCFSEICGCSRKTCAWWDTSDTLNGTVRRKLASILLAHRPRNSLIDRKQSIFWRRWKCTLFPVPTSLTSHTLCFGMPLGHVKDTYGLLKALGLISFRDICRETSCCKQFLL